MRQKGFAPILIIVILALVGIIGAYYYETQKGNAVPIPSLAPMATSTPTPKTPAPKVSTSVPTSIPTTEPTPTPVVRSFEEEEKLMRETLAGFDMYIGTKNTAGALSFFTPPKTDSAKAKLNEIRSKNLPYGIKSWSFSWDSNGLLLAEEIKGGYKVRMTECRTNSDSCLITIIELVRDESAENGFSVDRYYTSAYAYQNNLGEEIKYQGFGL